MKPAKKEERRRSKPLPPELLKQLRGIEIRTQRLANEQLSGTYSSVFKGQGLSFREVRAYNPGDDVRWIDWNVSARMNETFVKVFVEEREMTVMLVCDMSQSEQWGTRRASIALALAARAHAFLRHRGYVTPEDVKAIGPDVLRHRVVLTYEAEAEEVTSEQIVRRVFEVVEVP